MAMDRPNDSFFPPNIDDDELFLLLLLPSLAPSLESETLGICLSG